MSAVVKVISGICVLTGLIIVCQAQVDTLFSEWRPNADSHGIRFVGNKECIGCHAPKAAYVNTPMAQALEVAPDCRVFSERERLSFRNGSYTFEISRQGKAIVYSVGNGTSTITEPILYCFGQGHVGQTYVFRHNGVFYETRVSYYEKIRQLDFTIGHRQSVPTSVEDALGRAIGSDEQLQCFGCHTTGAVSGRTLSTERLTPGIGCEACHGPGEKHVVAMKEKKTGNLHIFDPANLGAFELSQSFCGTCHTSFEQAMLMPGQSGINNIRFQPYRIFNSRGHNTNDRRIGCLACHDPHQKLSKEVAYYDQKCLACHLSKAKGAQTVGRNAAACPVSTNKCVSCHMPKVELPGMHASFTDHWIRIARPNEPTPR